MDRVSIFNINNSKKIPSYFCHFHLSICTSTGTHNGKQNRIFPERFDRNFGFLFTFCSVCVRCARRAAKESARCVAGCSGAGAASEKINLQQATAFMFSLSSSLAQILLPLAHRRQNHIFGADESLDFLIANRLLTAACVRE